MVKKRRSGGTQRPTRVPLVDAVSDDDDGDVIGSNLHLDEVDTYYDNEDNQLAIKLKGSRSKNNLNYEDVNDVFGLSDSDDDFMDDNTKKGKKKKAKPEKELGEDEFDAEEVTGGWGTKKKHFYGGNPNEKPKKGKSKKDEDDENELNEAEAEEKESRFLQEKQLQNLTDEDFLFDAFTSATKRSKKSLDEAKEEENNLDSVKLDLSKLSRREKVRMFERESPEFASIVADFDVKMRETSQKLQPIIDLMNQGVLPKDGPAAEYVRTKHQLSVNYGVNIACYLMFKSRKVDLRIHPVTARLVQYKKILDEMESSLDPFLMPQIDKILKMLEAENGIRKLEKMVNKADPSNGVEKPRLKKPKKTLQLLKKSSNASDLEAHQTVNQISQLTQDEAMAVELYSAIKKKKKEATNDGSEMDEDDEDEVEHKEVEETETEEQRRSITYEMSKNKGLIPKRSKLQRNPRVKHRHKYEKAKIRRKGQIREVRKEVKKYAGEISGINKRVKKGIKIA